MIGECASRDGVTLFFFFQAEDGIRDYKVTGVQTCALPIFRVFRPLTPSDIKGDLVWIGNWGDEERTLELCEFLLDPVRELGIKSRAYGEIGRASCRERV